MHKEIRGKNGRGSAWIHASRWLCSLTISLLGLGQAFAQSQLSEVPRLVWIRIELKSGELVFSHSNQVARIPIEFTRRDKLASGRSQPSLINQDIACIIVENRLVIVDRRRETSYPIDGLLSVTSIVRTNETDAIFFINADKMLCYDLTSRTITEVAEGAALLKAVHDWFQADGRGDKFVDDLSRYRFCYDRPNANLYFTDPATNSSIFRYSIAERNVSFVVRGLEPQVAEQDGKMRLFYLVSGGGERGIYTRDVDSLFSKPRRVYSGEVYRYRALGRSYLSLTRVNRANFLQQPWVKGFSILNDGKLTDVSDESPPDDVLLIP